MSSKSFKQVFSSQNMRSNIQKGNDEKITIRGKFKSANIFNVLLDRLSIVCSRLDLMVIMSVPSKYQKILKVALRYD
jgi:hypothetical protein